MNNAMKKLVELVDGSPLHEKTKKKLIADLKKNGLSLPWLLAVEAALEGVAVIAFAEVATPDMEANINPKFLRDMDERLNKAADTYAGEMAKAELDLGRTLTTLKKDLAKVEVMALQGV